MPVILRPRDYDRWLDREVTEQPPVDLLRPFNAEQMEMKPANPAVGNYRNNGPEMMVCPADAGGPELWD
jgi:putative SOS response-associated peptidase YedK